MDIQLKRGLIEICVLKVLTAGDSYGYQLIKDISPYMEISESTLYPILKRLEAAKMLSVYSAQTPTPSSGAALEMIQTPNRSLGDSSAPLRHGMG